MLGRVWKTWHEKTRSSVFFNLESRLAFLASELVQAVLSGDDFRADDLMAGDQPVTVFIGTPLRMAEAMRPLHRLLLAAFLGSLTASLDETADGRPKKRRLLMLLDEFPALGKHPGHGAQHGEPRRLRRAGAAVRAGRVAGRAGLRRPTTRSPPTASCGSTRPASRPGPSSASASWPASEITVRRGTSREGLVRQGDHVALRRQ